MKNKKLNTKKQQINNKYNTKEEDEVIIVNLDKFDDFDDEKESVLDLTVDSSLREWGLSIRTANCLSCAGIKTPRQLFKVNFKQLAMIKNLGFNSFKETIDFISWGFVRKLYFGKD